MKTESDGIFSNNVNKKSWQHYDVKSCQKQCNQSSSQLFEVTEVCPGLLLCGATMVGRTNHPVTCIVNAAPELPDPPLPDTIKTIKIHILDNAAEPLDSYFDQVADVIEKIKEEGGITLVHCVAGVSRSATLCLAYLIKYNQMTFKQAFQYLKSLRPCIRPNLGFFKQLINYEKKFYPSSSVEIVFNDAAQTYIPSVYEEEYKNTLNYQRLCGRH